MRASIAFVVTTACWHSPAPAPEPPEPAPVAAPSKPRGLTLDNLVGVWTTRYPHRATNNTLTIRPDASFEAIDHGDGIVGTGRIVVVRASRTLELHYERLVDKSGDREFDHVQKSKVERLRARVLRVHDGSQVITWTR